MNTSAGEEDQRWSAHAWRAGWKPAQQAAARQAGHRLRPISPSKPRQQGGVPACAACRHASLPSCCDKPSVSLPASTGPPPEVFVGGLVGRNQPGVEAAEATHKPEEDEGKDHQGNRSTTLTCMRSCDTRSSTAVRQHTHTACVLWLA